MCTQKVLTQKTILPIEKLEDPENRFFFGLNAFWVYLLLRSNIHVWNKFKKNDFNTPFDIFKAKRFHLIEESMCTFYELKSPKRKQPHNTS